jgi:hypothetical protein
MKVMVACEFSGIVRDAFIEQGHEAVSCDLLPSESRKGQHIQGDVRDIDLTHYDLLIAHPPCTYLCRSGLQWVHKRNRYAEQQEALDFVHWLLHVPMPMIAVENPIGIISTKIRKPDQIVQPYMFGVGETKATCLWLVNLPLLQPTCIVAERKPVVHFAAPSADRWKLRSKTCVGVAQAMALQWGALTR